MLAFSSSGWSEELPAQLSGGRLRDSWPSDPPEDGVWHCLRAAAPPQIQLHTQVQHVSQFSSIYLHQYWCSRKDGSTWMLFAPPAGLSLQQHPGAAWVVVTNSSISDFVAGVEPLSLWRSHVVAARRESFLFMEEVRLNKVTWFDWTGVF